MIDVFFYAILSFSGFFRFFFLVSFGAEANYVPPGHYFRKNADPAEVSRPKYTAWVPKAAK